MELQVGVKILLRNREGNVENLNKKEIVNKIRFVNWKLW